ncbi:hypothetical protein RCL1_005438 [Eukaryota sp. TZLM3-RCL]
MYSITQLIQKLNTNSEEKTALSSVTKLIEQYLSKPLGIVDLVLDLFEFSHEVVSNEILFKISLCHAAQRLLLGLSFFLITHLLNFPEGRLTFTALPRCLKVKLSFSYYFPIIQRTSVGSCSGLDEKLFSVP